MYGCVGHFGNVTWTIYINFRSPLPWSLHMNLALIDPAVSETCLKIMVMYMYIAHCGRRTDAGTWVHYISSPSGELNQRTP